MTSSEWDVVDTKVDQSVTTHTCCQGDFPLITFKFYFARRSLFYVLNLIFPIAVITLLTTVAFLLPAESGKKFSQFFFWFSHLVGNNYKSSMIYIWYLCLPKIKNQKNNLRWTNWNVHHVIVELSFLFIILFMSATLRLIWLVSVPLHWSHMASKSYL